MQKIREITFFALQRMIGSRAGVAYRQLLAMEQWSASRLHEWQDQQLSSLLLHAASQVPFYRNDSDLGTPPQRSRFPIITKTELSGRYRDLMSDDMQRRYASGPARGYDWLEVTSGGTTGVPTTVIHDADFRDKDRASRAYEQYLCGFPFGTPHIRLWGSMHDIQNTKASGKARVMSALSGEILLNAFQMEDERLRDYLRIINESGVDYMLAYVDGVHQLARFVERHGLTVRPMKAIMTTGGTLTEDVRADLVRIFGARVHNKYGSRDAGELGCECEHGGLHILPHILVEVVDEHDRVLPPGEIGRVLITFIGNRSFPLIRFDITDRAALADGPCPCGRPFPRLQRLEGRATDFLFSTTGGFVSPVYIRHIVGVVHGHGKIRRFQFVQDDADRYTLAIEPERGVGAADLEPLRAPLLKDLKAVLGERASIDWSVADRIPETSSGKFRYIINRYRAS